jgi:hypothetical protein
MKKFNSIITSLALISIFAAFGCISAMAQRLDESVSVFAEEVRPFDFANKYYSNNGVQPYFIINRPTGTDGKSIFTKTTDERFNGVRLLETFPAYNYDGSFLYFNMYGELYGKAFNEDVLGERAIEVARSFPMFVFPSALVRGNVRQANVLDAREGYFTKNPLGVSLIVEVEYTFRADTEEGAKILNALGARNGYSLDGTPIIKTVEEINYLTRMELITQRVKGLDRDAPSYAIVKAIQTDKPGAITPDAFLTQVITEKGEPLETEKTFLDNFICLQKTGAECSDGTGFQR